MITYDLPLKTAVCTKDNGPIKSITKNGSWDLSTCGNVHPLPVNSLGVKQLAAPSFDNI